MLISYENEAIMLERQNATSSKNQQVDYVLPPQTFKIENPAAVVVNTSDHKTAAKAFVDFLFTPEAQRLWAKQGSGRWYPRVIAETADQFPGHIEKLWTIDEIGKVLGEGTAPERRQGPDRLESGRRRALRLQGRHHQDLPTPEGDSEHRNRTHPTGAGAPPGIPRPVAHLQRCVTRPDRCRLAVAQRHRAAAARRDHRAVVRQRLSGFWDAITDDAAIDALTITVWVSLVVALINVVFGTLIAWVLVRDEFPGKAFVNAIIDLPFALPTIVASLVLLSLYGPNSPIDIQLNATQPALVIALTFVTLPFVVRQVQPVLLELDRDVEEAAAVLGASNVTTFTKIVLPALLPSILTGAGLAFTRAIGEFGSVVLIGGNIPGETQVASQYIQQQIEVDEPVNAAAISVVPAGHRVHRTAHPADRRQAAVRPREKDQ